MSYQEIINKNISVKNKAKGMESRITSQTKRTIPDSSSGLIGQQLWESNTGNNDEEKTSWNIRNMTEDSIQIP